MKVAMFARAIPPLRAAFLGAALGMVAQVSVAQAPSASSAAPYPARLVRLVVPFAAGSGTDLIARAFAPRFADALGQQVLIDNRPGASGNVGTELVARAQPDGYTLLLASNNFAINPALFAKVPYDPAKDFLPVGRVANLPYLLVVNAAFPAKNVLDFVAVARARPGQLTYASAGNGTPPHIAAEVFKQLARVDLMHIPYKSSGAALADVISGQVQAMFVNPLSSIQHVRSGKLRALGVSTARPIAAAPEVPTIADSGVPGYEVTLWSGILAPSGTPREVISRLNRDLNRVLETNEVREKLATEGSDVATSTPEAFGALLTSELDRLARLAKAANMKLD